MSTTTSTDTRYTDENITMMTLEEMREHLAERGAQLEANSAPEWLAKIADLDIDADADEMGDAIANLAAARRERFEQQRIIARLERAIDERTVALLTGTGADPTAIADEPADVTMSDEAFEYLAERWHHEYAGDIDPDGESRPHIAWLWTQTTIGIDSNSTGSIAPSGTATNSDVASLLLNSLSRMVFGNHDPAAPSVGR